MTLNKFKSKQYTQKDLEKDWNTFAEYDPMWAILRDESKRGGGWNEEEFYKTGEPEVKLILNKCLELGLPKSHMTALDIGCGLGRLTNQLVGYFDKVTGVDISQVMLDKAKEHNPNINWVRANSLEFLGEQKIDMIMERIVLQHIEPKYAMNYVKGAIKHLSKDGLFTFMMPPSESEEYKRHRQIAIDTRTDNPVMLMYSVSCEEVEKIISNYGGRLLEKENTGGRFPSCVYWVTK